MLAKSPLVLIKDLQSRRGANFFTGVATVGSKDARADAADKWTVLVSYFIGEKYIFRGIHKAYCFKVNS